MHLDRDSALREKEEPQEWKGEVEEITTWRYYLFIFQSRVYFVHNHGQPYIDKPFKIDQKLENTQSA